ncbi:MAG: hypothetical protein SangKO_035590 [Sandaracinaceae bacterium]
MMQTVRLLLLTLLALCSACGGERPPMNDAGRDAAPIIDAQPSADAGREDAGGRRDAGRADVCGDGRVSGGELCDGDCPTDCDDGLACTTDTLTGSAATCDARCVSEAIVACAPGDGCCAPGCDATTDVDCSATCGNGVVEEGEVCDGDCPTTCFDGLACTTDALVGAAASCSASCSFAPISACVDGDGCCAPGCDSTTDDDCSPSCGNGVVEGTETCDGDCPTTCDDGLACTRDGVVGSAASCSATCSFTPLTSCVGGDGCCAPGCDATTDSDCSPTCGNGVVEGSEVCDGSCPTSCDDGMVCTNDTLVGSAATCSARCSFTPISACAAGDGCCPSGCNATNDSDCAAVCGNGVIEPGENCDGGCPTMCDDGVACTTDTLVGSAADCSARCMSAPVTACVDGDGCCPSGCTASFDDDCVCVPTASCAGRTCGTVADGCGVTLRCGPDCRTWTRVTRPPVAPTASGSFGLAHLGMGRALYVDGASGRTFEYDATTDTWTETATATVGADPLVRLAYVGSGRVVGIAPRISPSTWEYDAATGAWTEYAPPPAYIGSELAYAGAGRALAFGSRSSGPGSVYVAATFLYNATSHAWAELPIATQPPARGGASLEWLGAGRLLLLGGVGNASFTPPVLDDAWVFDTTSSSWTLVSPPASSGRSRDGVGHLATDVVLTYGGLGYVGAPGGSRLFRRYEGGTDTWTATTSGALVTPGILYANEMVHLSPGRVLMIEGISGTSPSTSVRGFAWVYDEGTGVSDMAP